ncbi:hypothetical protein J7I89_14670 [Arthrobacter sp. ISL-5]|nr:hypothetical protein [Arthrobacter sp. ISL-5]
MLMGLAGLLVGGALSFRQQKKPLWTQIAFYVLAGMSLLAAYLLTLPGHSPQRPESPAARCLTETTALHGNNSASWKSALHEN